MSRVIRTDQSDNDLLLIWEYIANDSRSHANAIVKMIEERYGMLAQHPRVGPARPDLGDDIRYSPVGSYVIIYREHIRGIEIIRVLHGARNLEAIFHNDEQ